MTRAAAMLPTRMQDAPPKDDLAGPRHRAPRNKHWGLRITLVLLIVLAGLAVAATRYYSWCGEASGPTEPVTITVRKGASGSEVVDAMHEQGIVRCGLVSKWLLRRSGLQDEFRAGTFELTTNMTPNAAFAALTEAPEMSSMSMPVSTKPRLPAYRLASGTTGGKPRVEPKTT